MRRRHLQHALALGHCRRLVAPLQEDVQALEALPGGGEVEQQGALPAEVVGAGGEAQGGRCSSKARLLVDYAQTTCNCSPLGV